MKTLLGCLMCQILVTSQCFAIDGGPFGGGGSQVVVTGTYAGVLVPIPIVLDPGPPEVTTTDNSIALFTIRVPSVGLADGTAAVFRNGFSYSGTIQGSADPDSAKLTAIVTTSFIVVTQTSGINGDQQDITKEFDANGQFNNAHIVANTNTASTAATRIRGKASLTYIQSQGTPADANGDSGGPIFYKIKGFKQSTSSGLIGG
jgi:hypothetical protein